MEYKYSLQQAEILNVTDAWINFLAVHWIENRKVAQSIIPILGRIKISDAVCFAKKILGNASCSRASNGYDYLESVVLWLLELKEHQISSVDILRAFASRIDQLNITGKTIMFLGIFVLNKSYMASEEYITQTLESMNSGIAEISFNEWEGFTIFEDVYNAALIAESYHFFPLSAFLLTYCIIQASGNEDYEKIDMDSIGSKISSLNLKCKFPPIIGSLLYPISF